MEQVLALVVQTSIKRVIGLLFIARFAIQVFALLV